MLRPLAGLLVVIALLASGCLAGDNDDGHRLAQPTDRPITIPTEAPRRPTAPTVNLSDPGYQVTESWRVGDGWDYESNQSHFRQVRVLDSRLVNGVTRFLVEERSGPTGLAANLTTRSWVESRGWTLLNRTDHTGAVETFTPGQPLRHWKNGSHTYNVTRVESSGRESVRDQILVQSRILPSHQSLLFPWGYVEAKRVEEMRFIKGTGGNRTEGVFVEWVHRDYLNAVQYELPSGETFKLTAVKANDFRRGTLA